MNVVFYTNIVSPHQMPWCREMVKLIGKEQFFYVAEEPLHRERAAMGWSEQTENWIHILGNAENDQKITDLLEDCDVLICSLRKFDLFQRRIQKNLRTYYMFERWFKPPVGMLRMLHPGYFQMCRQACRLAENGSFHLLPIGIPAVNDWFRMEAICCGRLLRKTGCTAPRSVMMPVSDHRNMHLWGYFVEESPESDWNRPAGILQILWCGRMLDWKRVDTLVKAVVSLLKKGEKLHLQLIGDGPEREKLMRLTGTWNTSNPDEPGISFLQSIPMVEIRKRMRKNDVYVLSSDGGEGWGAAANEAMNERMLLIGTKEAGSTVTMIEHGKNGFLYPAKNVKILSSILKQVSAMKKDSFDLPVRQAARMTITTEWSPACAARKLLESFTA